MAQYKNQGQATLANPTAGYPQDDSRIPAGPDLQGRFSTVCSAFRMICHFLTQLQGFQPRGVIEHGRPYGTTGAPSAAGADAHTYVPAAEAPAPVPSESLRNIARRCVLDPGTHIDAVHMASNGYGRLKVFITLDAVDGI